MASSNKKDLGYLGVDFQFKLVKCFIEDPKFFISLSAVIDQNMFTDSILRKIVKFIKDRYNFNEVVPNYFELDVIIRSKISDAVTLDMALATLDKIKKFDLSGMDLVENESDRFFKQQNLMEAMYKSIEIIKQSNSTEEYYRIEDIIKDAVNTNTKLDFGYNPMDGVEDALRDDYRSAIPTGFKRLDDALYGGLAKGELGIIIAPSGTGKTSATTGFAANAATYKCEQNNNKGFKVLHVHFEDEDKNIKRKYYGFITGFDACDLSLPSIRPVVINMLNNDKKDEAKMIKENIVCIHPQSGELSASELKHKIKQFIARGFKPDLIIVDYFESLKLEKAETSADKEWTREGITMRKLESIAHEFDVALWVPVQGTKDSLGAEYVGLQQAGGSVKKVQIGHTIISFARTEEMKVNGLMNVFIQKFRAGKLNDAKMLNVHFNNGTGKFSDSDNEPLDGVDFQSQSNAIAAQIANNYRNRL